MLSELKEEYIHIIVGGSLVQYKVHIFMYINKKLTQIVFMSYFVIILFGTIVGNTPSIDGPLFRYTRSFETSIIVSIQSTIIKLKNNLKIYLTYCPICFKKSLMQK